mmetsp:Transcript_12213/g.18451  ORF Transcript_12213/g.18451 Transcript_12213/m.18451 type:complete len:215 (+) Transcript_12213:123-767(+)
MSRHGSERNGSSEWESSKSSHVKVGIIVSRESILKGTVDLITTQGSGNKRSLLVISVGFKGLSNLGNKLGVGKSTREDLLNLVEWTVGRTHEVLNKISAVIVKLEAEGKEVITESSRGVDLNSSKNGNLSISGNSSSSLLDNSSNHILLGIVKSVWKLLHLVVGSIKTLSIRKKHVRNISLLGVKGIIRNRGLLGCSRENISNVSRSGDGRSTA